MPAIYLEIKDSHNIEYCLCCISTIEEISEVIKKAPQVAEPKLLQHNRANAYHALGLSVRGWFNWAPTVGALIIAAKPALFLPFIEPMALKGDIYDTRCVLQVSDYQWAFEVLDDERMLHDFNFNPSIVFLDKYPVECEVQVAEFI